MGGSFDLLHSITDFGRNQGDLFKFKRGPPSLPYSTGDKRASKPISNTPSSPAWASRAGVNPEREKRA